MEMTKEEFDDSSGEKPGYFNNYPWQSIPVGVDLYCLYAGKKTCNFSAW